MTDPCEGKYDIVSRLRDHTNRDDNDIAEAAAYIERLRDERDEARRLLKAVVAMLTAEHDALRAERDEVRKSYCSLMEAYRGGNGRVTANKLGWGYLFEEENKENTND